MGRVELRCKSYRVGRQRLRAVRRRRGLPARQPKAFTPRTTDSTHELRCAPRRLLKPNAGPAHARLMRDFQPAQ